MTIGELILYIFFAITAIIMLGGFIMGECGLYKDDKTLFDIGIVLSQVGAGAFFTTILIIMFFKICCII